MRSAAGRLGRVGAVAALACATAPRAGATSVAPMTVQALADHAACVVSGEVLAVRSYWTRLDGRLTIESRLVLGGAESIKGDAVGPEGTFALTPRGGDGQVGTEDLLLILVEWGRCP